MNQQDGEEALPQFLKEGTTIGTATNNSLLTMRKASSSEETSQKKISADMLRDLLPACQPQEGSPANTFTQAEIQELAKALPSFMNLQDKKVSLEGGLTATTSSAQLMDICQPWTEPDTNKKNDTEERNKLSALSWHGAPTFHPSSTYAARQFRQQCRVGLFDGPTNGQCPGFLQCNLVVLPQDWAYDFLLFCQRNPQACPLLEVCDQGSYTPTALAPTADLRTDCPQYAIYRNGKLDCEVKDVTEYWPENSVAFLIGCSFSYDGALLNSNIPLRSFEQHKNVPMYRTNLKCRPAGRLQGNVVVSMKPIPALQISREVEITSAYKHAHGGPVCIGRPDCIGITNLDRPDWGDAVELHPNDVPVFHACGVTPQAVLLDSNVPFAITHKAGHMFVTDMPSDMGVL